DEIRHVSLREGDRLEDARQLLRGFLHLDRLADPDLVRWNVDAAAVHTDMAVIDELPCGKDGRGEFRAIGDRVEPALQQADQVVARIALHPDRFLVIFMELPLRNIAVIALDLLLGLELGAEIRGLALAALTVLAGAIFTLVDRAFRPTPDVFAHPA